MVGSHLHLHKSEKVVACFVYPAAAAAAALALASVNNLQVRVFDLETSSPRFKVIWIMARTD